MLDFDGKAKFYPRLQPYPKFLWDVASKYTEHMTKSSAYYNNIFSIASTGIDNGRDGVGFEQIRGDSAVKLNGRTYHYLADSTLSGGIAYF
jgi:hypothetical protein